MKTFLTLFVLFFSLTLIQCSSESTTYTCYPKTYIEGSLFQIVGADKNLYKDEITYFGNEKVEVKNYIKFSDNWTLINTDKTKLKEIVSPLGYYFEQNINFNIVGEKIMGGHKIMGGNDTKVSGKVYWTVNKDKTEFKKSLQVILEVLDETGSNNLKYDGNCEISK